MIKKKQLTKQRISKLFTLPINKAAEELQISESYLKRICRQQNIKLWPYRQVR